MDEEEVVMLIRAVLASKKYPITINELQSDFDEVNGSSIPYDKLGHQTLIKFLKSIPDKVNVQSDSTGRTTVSAVIDPEMSKLSKLVRGQKSTKKKKKANKKPVFNNNNNRYNMPSSSTRNRTNFLARGDNYENYARRPPLPPPTNYQRPNNYNRNNFSRQSSINKNTPTFARLTKLMESNLTKSNQSLNNNKRSSSATNSNQSLNLNHNSISDANREHVIDDLWIKNASYFLVEHEILVVNVLTADELCVRLVGKEFSAKYAQMLYEMNVYYKHNLKTLKNQKFRLEESEIYAVYMEKFDAFYRVQLIEKEHNNNMAFCCFVDEGYNEDVPVINIYQIHSDFLKLKFQIITIKINNFYLFDDNLFIINQLKHEFKNNIYLARKTTNNPLTVNLYDKNNKTFCVNDDLLTKYSHFHSIKLTGGTKCQAVVSYFDDTKKLTYLQVEYGNRRLKLEELIYETSKYFEDVNKINYVNTSDIKENKLFCAKFATDERWYRVRIMNSIVSNMKTLVEYVDFGNHENVDIKNLREIPDKFREYKLMPFQAIPVIVTQVFNSEMTIVDLIGEEKPVCVEVDSVNVKQIPYVRLIYNDETESSEDDDEDGEGNGYPDDDGESTKTKNKNDNNNNNNNNDDSSDDESSVDEAIHNNPNRKIVLGNNRSKTNETFKITIKNDSKIDTLVERLNDTLKLNNNEDNEENAQTPFSLVKTLHISGLARVNLPPGAYVYVTNVVHPSDFSITLYENKEKFDRIQSMLSTFYSGKEYLKANELVTNHLYVAKNGQNKFFRIKFCEMVIKGLAKCYQIDTGKYDVIEVENIYYLAKTFTDFEILCINSKLAYVTYDTNSGKWSDRTQNYFQGLFSDQSKIFRSSIVGYDPELDYFTVELFDVPSRIVISKHLIDLKCAQPLSN